MPFLKLMRANKSHPIWVNTNQITTIAGKREFEWSGVYSEVWTSDGTRMHINMKPEEILKMIEDANTTPSTKNETRSGPSVA